MKNFKDKNGNLLAQVYTTNEIVANPQLSGNEPELQGVQIGDQKYKAPQGGGSASATYAHLYISNSYPTHITFQCDDTSISTYDDLVNYLKNKGFVTNQDNSTIIALPASGQHRLNGDSPRPVIGLTVEADYGTEDYSLYILDGEYLVPVSSEVGTFEITFLGN